MDEGSFLWVTVTALASYETASVIQTTTAKARMVNIRRQAAAQRRRQDAHHR